MTVGPETTLKPCEEAVAKMLKTGKFNASRLKAANMRRVIYADRAEIFPPAVRGVARFPILGIAARLKTKDKLRQECAWFYVVPELARNHVLQSLVDSLFAKAPEELKFFGFSTESAVWKVFRRHGLVAVTKHSMSDVEEWAKRLGVYDRLPETAFRTDPPDPKEGERWLFVQLSRL